MLVGENVSNWKIQLWNFSVVKSTGVKFFGSEKFGSEIHHNDITPSVFSKVRNMALTGPKSDNFWDCRVEDLYVNVDFTKVHVVDCRQNT